LRAAIFFAFASAVWALLPLVARQLLGGDASFYGLLLGAVGAGAIGGALIMPKLRERFDADGLLLGAAVVTAVVMGTLSMAPPKWVAIIVLLLLGAAWITALTTLNGTAQAVLPNWVRGRGLAVYLTARRSRSLRLHAACDTHRAALLGAAFWHGSHDGNERIL